MSGPVSGDRPGLTEPLATFAVATAVASALFWVGRVVPFVQHNLHGAIALVFLYAPALAARISRRPFDYRTAGLTIAPVSLNLKITALAIAVAWPPFFAAFLAFYSFVCNADLPLARYWIEMFAPICPRWVGWNGAVGRGLWGFRLPPDFALLALTQLLVVAVPEEFFFRGYLYFRLEQRWPSRRKLAGAPVGWPLLVTSLLFGLGHVLVDLDPARMVVFFPALAFGWMRARTGSIAAGALFHALCNVLSEILHTAFFR
jgi:uncharacterized protein